MKVEVLKDRCIGCGACQAIAEEVFEIGDDGFAQVILNNIPDDLQESTKDALENCPTSAISEIKE